TGPYREGSPMSLVCVVESAPGPPLPRNTTLLFCQETAFVMLYVPGFNFTTWLSAQLARAALMGPSSALPVGERVLQMVVRFGTPPAMPGAQGIVRESVR